MRIELRRGSDLFEGTYARKSGQERMKMIMLMPLLIIANLWLILTVCLAFSSLCTCTIKHQGKSNAERMEYTLVPAL